MNDSMTLFNWDYPEFLLPGWAGTGRVITGGQPSILCNDTGHTGPGPGSVITRHTDFRPRATGALSPI